MNGFFKRTVIFVLVSVFLLVSCGPTRSASKPPSPEELAAEAAARRARATERALEVLAGAPTATETLEPMVTSTATFVPSPTLVPSPTPTSTPPFADFGRGIYPWQEEERQIGHWLFANTFIEPSETNPELLLCPNCELTRRVLAVTFFNVENEEGDLVVPSVAGGFITDVPATDPDAVKIEEFVSQRLRYYPQDFWFRSSDDFFGPNRVVLFNELAAWIMMYLKGSENFECGPFEGTFFSDLTRSTKFAGCVEDLVREGLYVIGERPDEMLANRKATIEDFAKLLYRAYQLKLGGES